MNTIDRMKVEYLKDTDGTERTGVGICIGASSVTWTRLVQAEGRIEIAESHSIRHEGNPKQVLARLFETRSMREAGHLVVTGRRLRQLVRAASVSEPEALEAAHRFHAATDKKAEACDTIISAGGETFMIYRLGEEKGIVGVHTGNKCASGTGEFFLQQLSRMDMDLESALATADEQNPYRVAGRCSVFCKSDCTHALNKGTDKARIVSGLCEMMAGKVTELIRCIPYKGVMLVGGSARNHVMVGFLRRNGIDVHVPTHPHAFESLGAALLAIEGQTSGVPEGEPFSTNDDGFGRLPALAGAVDRVRFMPSARGIAQEGDECVVGLDVGSTTTKAVLLRKSDSAILASCYLRTNGDPVGASRRCHEALLVQLSCSVRISGLGVTGSGRQLAALHAQTPAVINEIIAHARAASFFDPEVDTLFEIGGQDAKYTWLTNGVASDYAMNEACSAGTGSFLEEAARESLNLRTEEIGDTAMLGNAPPNFNDQCAAFIGSDIKTAIQSGMDTPDIAAGIVYSICMNYMNRVKGNRTAGQRIFMQGGVCYNRAVPVAMAVLTGREIIVPPDPGLMGAFGVALETADRQADGRVPAGSFDLATLAARTAESGEPFICAGGADGCDRKCVISRIRIDGRTWPFGGACDKYYNLLSRKPAGEGAEDLVALREKFVFQTFGEDRTAALPVTDPRTVGINRSLMTHTLFPFFNAFFRALGHRVILSPDIDREGCERRGAAFCRPVEQAHGAMASLLAQNPDVLFLPHVKAIPVPGNPEVSVTCPFVQAEPYTLRTAFPEIADRVLLMPVLDMTEGVASVARVMVRGAKWLGHPATLAMAAFQAAMDAQEACLARMQQEGRRVLADLERHPREMAIVLVGRPYNAMTRDGNMGIPRKFTSRGLRVIPHDFLSLADVEGGRNMYWASGSLILKAARRVAAHPQLFAAYITNFSCGPDSFLLGYFRDIFGRKPSLTLELDSHTADAGIDTRIEAFLDVTSHYRALSEHPDAAVENRKVEKPFQPARLETEGPGLVVVTSDGRRLPLTHPDVHVLVPSMGEFGARTIAAALRHVGVRATAVDAPGERELKLGRGLVSCKECLPLVTTIGSLMRYLEEKRTPGEVIVDFMPETSGPCRFGQYNVLMQSVVDKRQLENVTMISLTSENSYAGFGVKFAVRAWHGVVLSDAMDDVRSALTALAVDPDSALALLDGQQRVLERSLEADSFPRLLRHVARCARELSHIPLKGRLEDLPTISLIGEIYVRRDEFSRMGLVGRLSRAGFLVRTAPVAEWLHYCDYIVRHRLGARSRLSDRVMNRLTGLVKDPMEQAILRRMASSGLFRVPAHGAEELVRASSAHVSERLTGETVLTVGAGLDDGSDGVDGVLSIGPFGCMPARISEAIVTQSDPDLPFLPIETDGNAFPQVIESRIEAFLLQVRRRADKRVRERTRGSGWKIG